jgi:hypothetical protein
MPAILGQSAVGFELYDGSRVSGVLVGVVTRGVGWFAPPKALARKRLADAVSRLAERRKSMVAPLESTARYKYTHLPFDSDVGLA